MNWDAIGAVGEIVGALAVVISVIYLAVQIRQTNILDLLPLRLWMLFRFTKPNGFKRQDMNQNPTIHF